MARIAADPILNAIRQSKLHHDLQFCQARIDALIDKVRLLPHLRFAARTEAK